MPNPEFSDATLVLVGHGSTLNTESIEPAHEHANALRASGRFAQVRECFWKVEPPIRRVLDGIVAPRTFVVPLFISEGYFTEEIIPRELGLPAHDPNARRFPSIHPLGAGRLFYCGPVGTHDSMTEVLLARARDVVARHPFPRAPKPAETTLFIAGHGTGRNENSRKAIEHHASRIRARNLYAAVHAVFMEEEPRISECYGRAQTRDLVVIPFFISDGLHSNLDIPVMLGEPERLLRERHRDRQPPWRNPTEKHGKRVWYSNSIGTDPHLQDVILERVREAARLNPAPTAS